MYILTLEKSDPEKVSFIFEEGEHVIGRGPQLQCTSKKVSRKHALLKITPDDGVILKSTHNNPCYHQSSNTQTIQIISFNKSIKLNNNDKIALALDHGWLHVKITNSLDNTSNNSNNDGCTKTKRNLEDNVEVCQAKKVKLDDANQILSNVDNRTNFDVTTPFEAIVKTEPIDGTEVATTSVTTTSDSTTPEIKQEPLNETTPTNDVQANLEVGDSTDVQVKQEPDNKSTNNKKDANSTNDQNAPSTSVGNSSRRDRCWYGSSCYRKNPMHRTTFSHPNDADYDSDPNDSRPNCCYGINCYRRNRIHREKYRHPGQQKIPDPPSKTKSKNSTNHSYVYLRFHPRPLPNLFVRRVRIPRSRNHRYVVLDLDAYHPYDNAILDEDLDIFDAESNSSDSDYFSGTEDL